MRASHVLLSLLVLFLLAAGGWFLASESSEGEVGGSALTQELALEKDTGPGGGNLPAAAEKGQPDLAKSSAASDERVELAAEEPEADEDEREGRRILGRVIDEFGAPVPDARVFVARSTGFGTDRIDLAPEDSNFMTVEETEANGQGEFSFDSSWRGDLRFAVRSPGFAPLRVQQNVEGGDEATVEDLVMQRSVILSGHVVDQAGNGVEGIRIDAIEASKTAGFTLSFVGDSQKSLTTSGPGGAFEIDELAAGPYKLHLRSEDYPDLIVTGTLERPGQSEADLRFVLEDGHQITGHVLGSEEAGMPLAVRARPLKGTAFDGPESFGATRFSDVDEEGRFRLRGLRDESYKLNVIESADDMRVFAEAKSSAVTAKAGDQGVELSLSPPCGLTFRVLDASNGQPFDDFEVESGNFWWQAMEPSKQETEPGVALFEDVSLDNGGTSTRLKISAEGYESLMVEDVKLTSGEVTDLGDMRLRPVAMITVRVLDDASGEPVEGARVRLSETQAEAAPGTRRIAMSLGAGDALDGPDFGNLESNSAKTNEEGVAEIPSLPGKLCSLTVRHRSFSDHQENVDLPQQGSQEFEVRLTEGGTVIVHVVDSKGEPEKGVSIEQTLVSGGAPGALPGSPGKTKSNSKGIAKFSHLQAGTHRFKIKEGSGGMMMAGGSQIVMAGFPSDDDGDKGQEVLVGEGTESEITLQTLPEGALSGRVTEAGEPLAGANLRIEKKKAESSDDPLAGMRFPGFGGGGDSARTDGQGKFTHEGLKVGEYTVTITHPTRVMPETVDIVIREGENQAEFDLSLAIIEGRVLDSGGEPAAGVTVTPKRFEEEGQPRRATAMRMVMSDGSGGAMTMSVGEEEGEAAKTDDKGRYVLRGVTSDIELIVETSSSRFQKGKSEPVIVGANQTRRDVDIEVFDAGSLKIFAVDASGDPVAHCLLTLEYAGEADPMPENARSFTGENGQGDVSSLRPGLWRISGQKMSMMGGPGGSAPEPIVAEATIAEVVPGEVVEVMVPFE